MKEEIIAEIPAALIKAKEKKAKELTDLGKQVVKLFSILNDLYPGRVYLEPGEAKNLKERLALNDLVGSIQLAPIIHFPEIQIKSSKSGVKPRLLRDFFVKLVFEISSVGSIRFKGFLGARGSLSKIELSQGYNHSHISSGGYFIFGGFCMGSSEIGKLYNGSLTEDQLYFLLFSIEPFLRHESVEGRPYKHMEQIFSARNVLQSQYPPYLQATGSEIDSISSDHSFYTTNPIFCFLSWMNSAEESFKKTLVNLISYNSKIALIKFLSGKSQFSLSDFKAHLQNLLQTTADRFTNRVLPIMNLKEDGQTYILVHKSYKVSFKKTKSTDNLSFEERPEKMTVNRVEVVDSLLTFESIVFKGKLYENDKDLQGKQLNYPVDKADFLSKVSYNSNPHIGSLVLNVNAHRLVSTNLNSIQRSWSSRKTVKLQTFLNTPYEQLT